MVDCGVADQAWIVVPTNVSQVTTNVFLYNNFNGLSVIKERVFNRTDEQLRRAERRFLLRFHTDLFVFCCVAALLITGSSRKEWQKKNKGSGYL